MSVLVRPQDNYFLDSASQINFFFEEKAFDESGKLQQAKELSINKIGHAMHDLDPVFRYVHSMAQQRSQWCPARHGPDGPSWLAGQTMQSDFKLVLTQLIEFAV